MILHRSTEFKKKFKMLSAKMQGKVVERLEIFVSDQFSPILDNHELHGEYAGCRSINITGDFRVVFEKIDEDNFYLLMMGTHNQLYE